MSRILKPFIKWWPWIVRFFASFSFCLEVNFHFLGIKFINCSHLKELLLFKRYSWFRRCQALTVPFISKRWETKLNFSVESQWDVRLFHQFECRYYTIKTDNKIQNTGRFFIVECFPCKSMGMISLISFWRKV